VKGGKFIQSMNLLLGLFIMNFPKSAEDIKGFLALGYSLKRASLNAAQYEVRSQIPEILPVIFVLLS